MARPGRQAPKNGGLRGLADFSWGTPTPEFRRLMERVLRPIPDDGNPADVAPEAKESPRRRPPAGTQNHPEEQGDDSTSAYNT